MKNVNRANANIATVTMTLNSDLDLLIMEQKVNKIKEQSISINVDRATQSGANVILNISLYSGVFVSSYYENIIVTAEIEDFITNTVTTQDFRITGSLFDDEVLTDVLLLRNVNNIDSSINVYAKSANLIFL